MSISLLSLFLFALLSLYSLGLRSYHQGSAQVDLQQNARIALHHLDRNLRVMDRFALKGDGSLEFFMPGDSRRHTYRVRFQDLEYVVGTSVTKVASGISEVTFTSTPEGILRFTVTAAAPGREYSLTSAIRPRNLVLE